MNLSSLGYSQYFEDSFRVYEGMGYVPARVYVEHKNIYGVYTESGELMAEVSGKFRYQASSMECFPAVGDWVAVSERMDEGRGTIHAVLPRKSRFSRKIAGANTEEQVLASNIDTVFLVNSLNMDFNLRRIERYLTMAWESGANPVIVLSKSDLCSDLQNKVSQVESIVSGVPVHVVSSLEDSGVDELKAYFMEGSTSVLLGSSGVGKSTLINCLMGDNMMEVGDIRGYDDKGRHTTTFRQLMILPSGGIVIDTPGMRELQLWNGEEGISETFEDIEMLADQCHFNDCSHRSEPKCAVKQAINEGIISHERFNSYLRLKKELSYLEQKQQQVERLNANRGKREGGTGRDRLIPPKDMDLYR